MTLLYAILGIVLIRIIPNDLLTAVLAAFILAGISTGLDKHIFPVFIVPIILVFAFVPECRSPLSTWNRDTSDRSVCTLINRYHEMIPLMRIIGEILYITNIILMGNNIVISGISIILILIDIVIRRPVHLTEKEYKLLAQLIVDESYNDIS